jgi:hypothetical protein
MNDPAHCGTCGNVCPTGESCVAGACLCQTDQECASSQGYLIGRCCAGKCVDVYSNDRFCGDCTTDCTPSGYCYSSRCEYD